MVITIDRLFNNTTVWSAAPQTNTSVTALTFSAVQKAVADVTDAVIGKDKLIFSQLSERLEAAERSAGRPVQRLTTPFWRESKILRLEMFDPTTDSIFLVFFF